MRKRLGLVRLKEQEKNLCVVCMCIGAGEYRTDEKGVEEWVIDMTLVTLCFIMTGRKQREGGLDIKRCMV